MEEKSGIKKLVRYIAFAVAAALTVFQLYTALFGVLSAVYQRAVHFGLAGTFIFLFNLTTKKEKAKAFHYTVNILGMIACI